MTVSNIMPSAIQNHTTLYQCIAQDVVRWRQSGYSGTDYAAIGDILRWAASPADRTFRLRLPQLQALETYWYLRLVHKTQHIFDLYRHYFPVANERRRALGVSNKAWQAAEQNLDTLFHNVRYDEHFVRRFKLGTLRETIDLDYPSYILALAMGTLVFAPGRTIIEALRELITMDYASVLPPHLYKQFTAAVKFTLTRDGQRDISIVRGSRFNVVVTNTEKIRIQQEKISKGQVGKLFTNTQLENARQEVANLRLQAIASLPDLAIFSDEAHHTYGQALGRDLKKVRKTVDYLAARTNLRCVINTTGTPYFKKQLLHDVIIWYGLAQGIQDGILKEVAGNILAYDFQTDGDHIEAYVAHVVADFFQNYKNVTLPDSTPAKLAIYFPNTAELTQLRPAVERALVELGLSPTLILEHHTHHESKADFDRFKLQQSPHRVALLVDRGVEGWDVPALFGCALVRPLKESNNFVLQAACRCLRQVVGNRTSARIYLSQENRTLLERQLQETYGETLADLDNARWRPSEKCQALKPLAPSMPKQRKTIPQIEGPVAFTVPNTLWQPDLEQGMAGMTEATLNAIYRLDLWKLYKLLQKTYQPNRAFPSSHWMSICEQVEGVKR